ncbi:MAG: efflux RND transporter permease subunit [Pseudobdellovibrionaceae bacterium]
MLESLVSFSIRNRLVVWILIIGLVISGLWAFSVLPIEAFPDVLNETVQVITQVPGQSAQDVERKITLPLEKEFTGIPKLIQSRSISEFGLSVVFLYFDDGVDGYWARQQVLEKIGTVNLPPNIQPTLAPMASVTGEIMRYELRSSGHTETELRTIEDWVIEKEFRSVPGVADVVGYGGKVKTLDVLVNPLKTSNYGISVRNVFDSIANANINAGGNMIQWPQQAFVIRSEGDFQKKTDIEHVGIIKGDSTSILVKDIAEIKESYRPPRGYVGKDDKDSIVQGIVLLRKGENPVVAGKAVEDKVEQLNKNHILPDGVKLHVYYDRMKLVHTTTKTVWKNLTEGLILVFIILMVFLKDIRATIIVASVVPLSLLFAFFMIVMFKTPANLISLGAIDFGMVVDGAVLIVESVLAQWQSRMHNHEQQLKLEKMVATIVRPVFFSMVMIILAYIPIFTLQRVEGKMFSPLAWTVSFTLTGALLLSILFIPVLLPWLEKHSAHKPHEEPPWFLKLKNKYLDLLQKLLHAPHRAFQILFSVMAVAAVAIFFMGSEFLPELDEGALWIRATFPHSSSIEVGQQLARNVRKALKEEAEVRTVVSQLGGPEDGTDPNLLDNCEFFVDLHPKTEWKRFHHEREEFIDYLRKKFSKFPGVDFNISQPIADNVEEAISGVKGKNAAKIFGPDLAELRRIAEEIEQKLKSVPGVVDVGLTSVTPMVPHLTISVDRVKVAEAGLNLQDVNDMIEIAVGGKTVTQMYEGETRIDVVMRAPEKYRNSIEEIKALPLTLASGKRVLLNQVATVKMVDGPQAVFRENNSRRIGVKFDVGDVDLGTAMKQILAKTESIKIPSGYKIIWGGEYENQKRAMQRLTFAIPLTIIILAVLLFLLLRKLNLVAIVLCNMIFASAGGLILLTLRGIPFSVSAGVGVLALFGVVSLDSVAYMSQFISEKGHHSLLDKIFSVGNSRFRPIVMTATLAALAILPAATSHGMGSETQRPLATIVIGGLFTAIPSTLFLLPTMTFLSEGRSLKKALKQAFSFVKVKKA